MTAGPDTRRHVAIHDGAQHTDVVLAERNTVADVLERIGIVGDTGLVVVGGDGRAIDPSTPAEQLDDGAVLSVIDPTARLSDGPFRGRVQHLGSAVFPPAIGWILGAVGILLAAFELLTPASIGPIMRVLLVVLSAGGALGALALGMARARGRSDASLPTLGALVLAFGAGAVAVPALPASGDEVSIFIGLASAAVLAAVLAVLLRPLVPRVQAGVGAVVFSVLAALWGGAITLGLPVSAPCAVALGVIPVVLRALPSMLLDVSPGAFIDFPRFQSLRWSVREQVPEPINTVQAAEVDVLVTRASARLETATLLLSGIAAVAAPWALSGSGTADVFVESGRIVLACCVSIGLVLGARRFSDPLLQWVPRIAAIVVAYAALYTLAWHLVLVVLLVSACGALAAGIVAGFVVAPVGRGARSLFWSRFGDVIESIAIALAVPAGLLAANTIEILRGVMA